MNRQDLKKDDILIVDDSAENLKTLRMILLQEGYQVRVAINGELALHSVATQTPDLIILDVRMPGMDGYEVCRRLKADTALADIPVIYISALTETEDKIKAFQAGGVDYVSKPFRSEEVLARVQTHLMIRKTQSRLEVANTQLRKAQKELDRWNAELEKRVYQRTVELENAVKALQKSEALLNKSQAVGSVGSWELDQTTNRLTCSEEVCRMLGLSPQKLYTNDDFLHAVHPDDRGAVEAYFLESLREGREAGEFEHRILRRDDDRVRTVYEKFEHIRDASGRIVRSVGLVQDISERKQAEDALRSIATEFSAVTGVEFFERVCGHLSDTLQVNYAFVGELIKNEDKVRVMAGIGNGKPLESFDYDLADTPCANVVGQSVCCYPSGVQSLFPKDHLLVEMGIEGYVGIPLFRRDGSALGIIVLLNCQSIDNEVAAVSLLQIFSERVAAEIERIQTEQALRQSENKYRNLVETLQEGVWAIDRDGATTFVNPHMAEMLGYTVEEMQGRHLFDFMDERGVEIAKHNLERRKQGISEQHDFEFLSKDGRRIYTSLGTSAITDDEGNYLGALAGVMDISERKRAEEALQELSHHLQNAREDFLSHLSAEIHDDLGQNLTSMEMLISLAEDQLIRNSDSLTPVKELMQEMRDTLGNTIARAREMIADMRPAVLDTAGLVEAIRWLVQRFQEQTGIDASVSAKKGECKLDSERSLAVFRIVQESLNNVRKHARASKLKVTVSKNADTLFITVKDNGIGFSRDSIDTEKHFGLMIMEERALFCHTELDIDSQPGKGTVVKLRIPLEERT